MSGSAYRKLEDRFRRIGALRDAEAMLHWDLATMMPKGGARARGDQLAVLKGLRHGLVTAPEIGEWLAEAQADASLDSWRRANVREMHRQWAHATALSEPQVEALSRATTACEAAWRQARADDDFAAVLPSLAELLGLVRETAAAKAERLGLSPYDVLLDEYEPEGRSDEIDAVFGELARSLPDLLQRVLDRQASAPPLAEPSGSFPIDKQRAIAVRLMQRFGFNFDHGRLDVSLHPFCGGTPDDVRITTRYNEDDFSSALMGVMHETGHALYERGLPRAWRGLPVGDARGMVLHESQSLLIEMQVCRSPAFLAFVTPMLRDEFGGDSSTWQADNLYRHYTRVEPGFIRVEADEVTYPAHVILRYDLERAMIARQLEPADLPGAWTEGMHKLLGITPPNDRLGCLQDIHWYDGAWGYFPTYTLGAIAAAQIFQAAVAADPAITDDIARGEFASLMGWLRSNVHAKGSLLSTRELLTEATGRPLDPEAFKTHLRQRYLESNVTS
jgi:carboxypeptidase Taq